MTDLPGMSMTLFSRLYLKIICQSSFTSHIADGLIPCPLLWALKLIVAFHYTSSGLIVTLMQVARSITVIIISSVVCRSALCYSLRQEKKPRDLTVLTSSVFPASFQLEEDERIRHRGLDRRPVCSEMFPADYPKTKSTY
jgi:hypothetical protein